MSRELLIEKSYLNIPVKVSMPEFLLEIFQVEETGCQKIAEYLVPIGEESDYDYVASIPVKEWKGKKILLKCAAPEKMCFLEHIETADQPQCYECARPKMHFTTNHGWINDPNGLVYHDGVYHLFYQHNPFNISWNNMTWGHAVSTNLLHWEEKDPVLFPDEHGTIFSGSAIVNHEGKLGLPKDALIFFYTASGGASKWSANKEFTQRIAYSVDGGRTLHKIAEPCVPTICKENRDPKVFYHKESESYVMVLYLEEADYGILRSSDLLHWEMSQRLTFAETWECPDLFCLSTEEGETCWFFWTANGAYYPGDFDGYQFHAHGICRHAYADEIPYAAQTYANTKGRRISIPWLRMPNDGRFFTGAMGIPVEMTAKKDEKGFYIHQKPVREYLEFCGAKSDEQSIIIDDCIQETFTPNGQVCTRIVP